MKKFHTATALVTHRDCLDGTTSAAIFLAAGGNNDNIHFVHPYEVNEKVSELCHEHNGPIHVIDMCPSDTMTNLLLDRGDSLICDHHVSNAKKLTDRPQCCFDITKCGCSLYAEALSTCLPLSMAKREIVDSVESYDLYRQDEFFKDGEMIADLAVSFEGRQKTFAGQLFSTVRSIMYRDGADVLGIETVVETISGMRKSFARRALDKRHVIEIAGHRAHVAAAPGYWRNYVGQILLEDSDCELAAIIDINARVCSLRSRKYGPDCAMIAESFGGGGHKNASGFQIDLKHLFDEIFS